MSWSRGAWVGYAAATAVVGAVQGRRTRAILAIVLGLSLLALLVGGTGALPAPVTERLTSFLPFIDTPDIAAVEITDANYASLERLAHWQSALDVWRDHPWLGVGFGNYAAAYAQYALPKWPMPLGHAHNYYLNVAAETGLLGLVAYICLWGIVFWYLWRVLRVTPDPRTRALALGALGMLVHVSVHNIVDNLWVHNMYIHVAIALGLVQVASRRRASAEAT
jgi:O-antigen ligase